MSIISYKHTANSGDLVASLPGLKHIYDTKGLKAIIYQRLNVPANYYEGAKHPVKTSEGVQVCMNEKQWGLLKPLLESQEYIERCEVWEGQNVDINLDKIREGDYSTLGYGSIARWQFYTHPYLACDLSKSWINAPRGEFSLVKDKVILNFTSRYRNPLITYYFLKEWEDKLIFSGTREEHENFCKENKLNIPYLEVENFLELTQCLMACKFVLCNQSMIWNICDAIKKLRILEVCRSASNCIPNGADGYDFLQQGALELYFKQFIK